jgi:hypothetical protein
LFKAKEENPLSSKLIRTLNSWYLHITWALAIPKRYGAVGLLMAVSFICNNGRRVYTNTG